MLIMFLLHVGQRIQEVCERQQQQLVASGTLGQTAGDTLPVLRPASLRLRKAWTEACNCSSVSVHVPTLISTRTMWQGTQQLCLEGRPKDLASNSASPLR